MPHENPHQRIANKGIILQLFVVALVAAAADHVVDVCEQVLKLQRLAADFTGTVAGY